MGKYDGYLLCSDLDGTLTYTQPSDYGRLVSEENCAALGYFQSEGGVFSFATGRLPEYLKENLFKYVVPNAPVVTTNGATIYSYEEARFIKTVFLDKKVLSLPVKVAEKYSELVEEVAIVSKTNTFTVEINGKESRREIEETLALRDNWCKFVFRGVNEKATLEFQNILKNDSDYNSLCNFPRSWATGQEVLDIDATKGNRVLDIKNILGNIHTVICVGDYENDISMIEIADKGYAVGNSIEKVKKAADFVTVSNNDSAIAKIISEI